MSQWTHIAGIIRVDSIGMNVGRDTEQVLNMMIQGLADIPTGSEGPLHYRILNQLQGNALSWGNIIFWDDLRDFGSEDDL